MSRCAWSRADTDELIARKVADMPLSACAAKIAYLDRRGRPHAARRTLLGDDLSGSTAATDIIRGFTALGITGHRHDFRFRTDDQIVLSEAVRAGNGIGFGQEPFADRDPL